MTARNVLIVFIMILLVIPLAVYAAEYTGSNAICSPAFDWSGCPWPTINPKTKKMCGKGLPCDASPPGGHVGAKCLTLNDCKGTGTEKGGLGDLSQFMQIMSKLMEMLKGKEKGGGGQPPQQQALGGACPDGKPMGPNGQCGCTAYYQVTAPSSDPCAYYVPPASQSLLQTNPLGQNSASNELLNALNSGSGANTALNANLGAEEGGGGSVGNVSDQLTGLTSSDAGAQTGSKSGAEGTQTTASGNLAKQAVNLQSGTRGNIEIRQEGATVIAQARDAQANTEVAGFYGSDTFGGEGQSVIAKMCQSRPWAKSIVTYIIPPSFFDSLCAWRGYQVGTPTPPTPPVVQRTTGKTASPAPLPKATSTPAVPPAVDIWAVPERVPLGARTSIFWNTKGVDSCTVTSPDGSFRESSLSGGAATVPLSGATTFTISCLTSGGTPVTDYVTVNLAI